MRSINKGKLVVIEGTDGSGKSTQTKLLISKLIEFGKAVKSIKYPQHGHPFFGLMVDDYLNNKFGPAGGVNAYLASLLYACDRWESKSQLNNWLNKGCWVIPDRYATSNFGHQLGKIKDDVEKDKFLQWENELEFKVFGIPKPDLVIYLDIPINFVNQLLSVERSDADKKYSQGKKDGHERDIKHLINSQKGYLYCVNKYDYWTKIDCAKDGKLMQPAEIHNLVWQKVKTIL